MKNLNKFNVSEISQKELSNIVGGNFWSKLVEGVVSWVAYKIADFNDDYQFNHSVQ